MQCKTCHYSLANLTEHRCPECGNEFDPEDPDTFDSPSDFSKLESVSLIVCILWVLGILALLLVPALVWLANAPTRD